MTAAAFDVVYGAECVRTLLVNDPSRHFPGDVQVLDPVERPSASAEVRAKPVPVTEIRQFARDLAEAGITRGMIVALAPNQQPLSISEIVDGIAQEHGVLMTIVDNVRELLLSAFAWSARPLSEVLAEFPRRVSDRLQGIAADPATIDRWAELVLPVASEDDATMSGTLELWA